MKLSFIILFYLLLMSNAMAWNFKGHQAIVEKSYYSADFELQKKLNLTLIKEGSIAPDRVFHDVRLHHYPPSNGLAEKWLNETIYYYKIKDYNKASYSFGVASHYISDSFVAPHYISREPSSLHSEFERLNDFKVNVKCYNFEVNLNESLKEASKNKDDWTLWTLSKNQSIPKREFEQATNLTLIVFLNSFNSSCNNFQTEVTKNNLILNKNVIIFLSLVVLIYLIYYLNKKSFVIKRIRF